MRTYKRTIRKIENTQLEYSDYFLRKYFKAFDAGKMTVFHYTFNHFKSPTASDISKIIKVISKRIMQLWKKDANYIHLKEIQIDYVWYREIAETIHYVKGVKEFRRNHHIHLLFFVPFFEFENKKLDSSGLNLQVNNKWSEKSNHSQLIAIQKGNTAHFKNTMNYFRGKFDFVPKVNDGFHVVGAYRPSKIAINRRRSGSHLLIEKLGDRFLHL